MPKTDTPNPAPPNCLPGFRFLVLLFALSLGAGALWDYFGTNAIQRARARPECAQIRQTAEVGFHLVPTLPSLASPFGFGSRKAPHVRYVAEFVCRDGQGGQATLRAEQFEDARGLPRADGSVHADRDLGQDGSLESLNWRRRESTR
jgi:hypothetical protein